jgi:hypothetical protein
MCFILGPITPQNTGFVAVQQTAGRVSEKLLFFG